MKLNFVLFLAFALSVSALAQSPSSILKRAEKAMGGAKALQSVRGWSKSGTITNLKTGTTGKFRSETGQPNFYHTIFDLDGFEIESGYNGKSGWDRDSRTGLKTLTGSASLAQQAEAAFRNSFWFNYKKEKSKILSGGKSAFEGKAVNVVLLNTAKGVAIKLYFDASTGLLLREEIVSGDVTDAFLYDDYRDVSGTRQPFRVKMEYGGESFAVEFDTIRPDFQLAKSTFDFPRVSGDPLPDIAKLFDELQSNEDAVEKLLDSYSYVQRSTKRSIGKDGVLRDTESETFQLSFYKGNRIRRLIEKNGKPLSKNDQEDADKDAAKRVEEIEKQIAKRESQSKSGPPSEEGRRVSIAEVLRASKLTNPRRERFRGREVIVFDFEPDPNFDFKNAKSMLKFFGKTAGVMWIDEKDKQVARIEATLFDNYNVGGGVLAKLKKGASFTLEQERLNDEIWLPSLADINLSIRVLLVKGIDLNQQIRSYDYRKFTTEVTDAKVDDQKKP